jgi:hypothetical protein
MIFKSLEEKVRYVIQKGLKAYTNGPTGRCGPESSTMPRCQSINVDDVVKRPLPPPGPLGARVTHVFDLPEDFWLARSATCDLCVILWDLLDSSHRERWSEKLDSFLLILLGKRIGNLKRRWTLNNCKSWTLFWAFLIVLCKSINNTLRRQPWWDSPQRALLVSEKSPSRSMVTRNRTNTAC